MNAGGVYDPHGSDVEKKSSVLVDHERDLWIDVQGGDVDGISTSTSS